MDPTLQDIYAARHRLQGVAYRTPLEPSPWLSDLAGCEVHLKLECWQRTRSFKFRGAYNALAQLPAEARARGLVAASAGNHGQGLALAAREMGVRCTVFVPENAPELKVGRIRALGATVRQVGAIYDDAQAASYEFARESGAHYLHAFIDPAVVAGAGTVGLEVVEDLPIVREVLVPVGGGGLVAGVAIAVHGASGGAAEVIGVQSTATASMHASFQAGHVVMADLGETLADGLHGGVEVESFERARALVDRIVLAPEARLADAIRGLYRHHGVIAEGSGAVGPAAILSGAIELRGPAVLVVTGGNIDPRRLADLLADG
jgi:threonine dehydratase